MARRRHSPEQVSKELTETGDIVVRPFGGSCMMEEVFERTNRRWAWVELIEEYCEAGPGRYVRKQHKLFKRVPNPKYNSSYGRVRRPGILWTDKDDGMLPEDGGRKRRLLQSV